MLEAAVIFLDAVVTQVSAAHLQPGATWNSGILRELESLLQEVSLCTRLLSVVLTDREEEAVTGNVPARTSLTPDANEMLSSTHRCTCSASIIPVVCPKASDCVLQLLAAKLPDPLLAAWHCRGLEAFARCIAAFPNLMPLILQKVRCLWFSAAHDVHCLYSVWACGSRGQSVLLGFSASGAHHRHGRLVWCTAQASAALLSEGL